MLFIILINALFIKKGIVINIINDVRIKKNRKITILLNLDSQDIGAITHSNPLHS